MESRKKIDSDGLTKSSFLIISLKDSCLNNFFLIFYKYIMFLGEESKNKQRINKLDF